MVRRRRKRRIIVRGKGPHCVDFGRLGHGNRARIATIADGEIAEIQYLKMRM